MKVTSNGKSFSSLKVTKGPRVTFDPHVEKHRPGSRREKHLKPPKQMRVPAKGYFTPHPGEAKIKKTLYYLATFLELM